MQDRNLERNLAKIEGLRARGGLAKVRRKLEELVREQPGTPDYRRELARACLDLGDTPAGLTEIRHLMRQQPAQRGEWRELVSQDLQAHGNPMAAQFLLEDSLGRGEHDEAQAFLEQLAEEQLDQLAQRYLVKIDNLERHQAVESAGASAADSPPLRLARWCIFHCALARKRCDLIVLNGQENVGSVRAEVEFYRPGAGWSAPVRGTKAAVALRIVRLIEDLAAGRA